VCALDALWSGKPNKRNESQKFLAIPGAYLSLSQVAQTPTSAQAQRDLQTASSVFLYGGASSSCDPSCDSRKAPWNQGFRKTGVRRVVRYRSGWEIIPSVVLLWMSHCGGL